MVAADCSNMAPALYVADSYYIVPKITEAGYIDRILEICAREKINGLFSLIDPELSLLALNAERFSGIGATVVGSSHEICERCLDKWEMYLWLRERRYDCAKTYISLDLFDEALSRNEIAFPVIAKPVRGSASMAVEKVFDRKRLGEIFAAGGAKFLVQQFMDGEDMDADAYIDLVSGEVVSIFTKRKLLMRAGEADKAISFRDEKLFGLLRKFIAESGFRGVIDIDVFKVGGKYYISEVNPRFGGVYPHAYECGLDFTGFMIENLSGRANAGTAFHYESGVAMMKYPEIMMKKTAREDPGELF